MDKVKTLLLQGSNNVTTLFLLDLWHYNCLGKSAETIYEFISERGEVNMKEIVENIPKHRKTINRAITRLFKNGLVEPLGDNHYESIELSPELVFEIIERHGTKGKSEKKIRLHNSERSRKVTSKILMYKKRWKNNPNYVRKGDIYSKISAKRA